jgi:hypothetical protein
MMTRFSELVRKGVAVLCILGMTVTPGLAQVIETPTVPLELPVEVELELAPGSLKEAPLWHELVQLLEDPYAFTCPNPAAPNECIATIERRQSFLPAGCSYEESAQALGVPACDQTRMPALKIWHPNHNTLTDEPMRLRESDGEISWDKPGDLFGPDDGDPATPLTDIIGRLVVQPNGNLRLVNTSGDPDLGPNRVVARRAFNGAGQILDEDGIVVTEFETPISEIDFLRLPADDAGVSAALEPYIGRPAARVLGKALFWDMQVGSDGVQSCGSCHFHAGTDNRTKNQLNPNHLGGHLTLEVQPPNGTLVAGDFPFRKLANPDLASEGDPNQVVERDSDDVMSSMGVRFRKFLDIPTPGAAAFGPPSNAAFPGVRPLLPDRSVSSLVDPTAEADPIQAFQGLRRVEPRNTPTIFGVAFNFDNFWDGRARHDANGGSVFGPADPQFHVFIDPGQPNGGGGNLQGATNGHFREDLITENPDMAGAPVRIRFSSLASLAMGPALSDFEMSFAGRNWQKLGKKLLQASVRPLANQLVDPTDSLLGPFSNQRSGVNGPVNQQGRPGLNVSYPELIRAAFAPQFWHNTTRRLNGTSIPCTADAVNGVLTPAKCDPFDGYVLSPPQVGVALTTNTNQFNQMEANFSLFFGLSLQIWQQVLIPDNTPFDRFMDANPRVANAVAQPGELNVLPPAAVPGLVGTLTFPNPNAFGPEELLGFDIFAGANVTAALPVGDPSGLNPAGMGSNPFHRTARCMICHIGPEQTDHTNNVNAGLLQGDTEYELPAPDEPEPTGPFRIVSGISLAEEVEENAQDGVEVENRNFAVHDDPLTPWDDRQVAGPSGIAFQDNGVYNIGVRPTSEDIMRGGNDAFGWPLSLAAMALKNLGGTDFNPCDSGGDACDESMTDFNPSLGPGGGLFEESRPDQAINPGLEMAPATPLLPPYLAPWANNLPAGELHPQIDELAFAPNTRTEPPFAEFAEIQFGSDTNCAEYNPALYGAGAPNFGWGPQCPNSQSAISNNIDAALNGTWPVANRVARNGAVKAPQLRNVELTGPYFHTGSYLTLRQVVDFYMRGGDFPITNAEDRDPNLVSVDLQAFGFGTTIGLPPQFQDGVPDAVSQYAAFPDTNAATPEPGHLTPERLKVALVKYLLSLTDRRVKFEMAPFDHPELFIPLDGAAPDNTFGRQGFVANLGNGMFRHIPAVGAAGSATPLPNFLEISSNPVAGDSNDHFDRK